ncbi:CoA-binding protein [Ciceribacter sp. L1K23]|uniref:CoA-binding protein n=1 Tax=Ciceribacter sp. L1K23 TaxID=2820276 RepID=UPI001B82BD56|nr:CoA-binding protein [Ciceribacter sp. L1K23]MBR0556045.1 CoA-binding protein [Ciceribacter sp. L1K23]
MDHDHYTDAYLEAVLEDCKSVAIIGASIDDKRPSFWVTGFLLGKGYTVYPVNPSHAGKTILGRHIYASLGDLPERVDLVDVFRRSSEFAGVVEEVLALRRRPKAIWAQLGVRDDGAARRAEDAGIRVVMDRALVTEYALVYGKTHGQAA